jgi:drug/metabolite transporter (DMT)-like permease
LRNSAKDLLRIHLAVLLFGLSGLFGRLVSLPAVIIVLGRVFFASVSMFAMFAARRKKVRLAETRDYLMLALAGLILAAHWTAFFMSIKVSTIAIAVLTYSTFPLFITFAEPLLFGEKLKKSDLFAAIAMFAGVILIVPEFNLSNDITVGVLWGMASSVTFAAMTLINRRYASKYEGTVIAFYEQITATAALIPSLFLTTFSATLSDMVMLLLLGVVFTAAAHSMFIGGMKTIKAQSAAMISSLESVYGIAAAAILLKEIPQFDEIAGGAIILGAALYSTVKSYK